MRSLCLIFLLMLTSLLQAREVADSSQVLEDVVVQADAEIRIEEEKPAIRLDLDFSDVVSMPEYQDWTAIDALTDVPQSLPSGNIVFRFSEPQLCRIQHQPVKTFRVRFKKLSRWQLTITASDGSVFRIITGAGDPPESIAWDGRSDLGQPLQAGENYAYSFTAIDKAGNKRTFPGETFSVPAYYMQLEERHIIGLARHELSIANGLELAPAAKEYAREVGSLVRHLVATDGVKISGDIRLARNFSELLAGELIVDADFFKFENVTGSHNKELTIVIE